MSYHTLDPQVMQVLETTEALSPGRYEDIGAVAARKSFEAMAALRAQIYGNEPVKSVEDRLTSSLGGSVSLRIYLPDGADGGPLPVVLFIHGGGWTVGSIDSYDGQARATCNRTGAAVVSVGYRLAPEHPYPAGLEDAIAAFKWTVLNIGEFGGDPTRIGVWGDSAGGNIAAALTLWSRAEGGPGIKAQCLVYPSVDSAGQWPSYELFAEGYLLTAATSTWFRNNHLPDSARREEPFASPLRAASHAGLPRAVIAMASHDVLRDQGEAYAAKLQADGVQVWQRTYPGLIHAFYALGQMVEAAQVAVDEICAEFRAALLA